VRAGTAGKGGEAAARSRAKAEEPSGVPSAPPAPQPVPRWEPGAPPPPDWPESMTPGRAKHARAGGGAAAERSRGARPQTDPFNRFAPKKSGENT